jgi:hypothetical protein
MMTMAPSLGFTYILGPSFGTKCSCLVSWRSCRTTLRIPWLVTLTESVEFCAPDLMSRAPGALMMAGDTAQEERSS